MYVVHVRVRKTYSTEVRKYFRKYNVLYGSTFESTFVRKYFRTKVQLALQLLPYGSTEELRKYFRIITSGSTFVRRYFRSSYILPYKLLSYVHSYILHRLHTLRVSYLLLSFVRRYFRTFVLSYVRRYVTSTCTYIRIQNIVVLREYGSTLFTVRVHVRTKYEGTSGSTKVSIFVLPYFPVWMYVYVYVYVYNEDNKLYNVVLLYLSKLRRYNVERTFGTLYGCINTTLYSTDVHVQYLIFHFDILYGSISEVQRNVLVVRRYYLCTCTTTVHVYSTSRSRRSVRTCRATTRVWRYFRTFVSYFFRTFEDTEVRKYESTSVLYTFIPASYLRTCVSNELDCLAS